MSTGWSRPCSSAWRDRRGMTRPRAVLGIGTATFLPGYGLPSAAGDPVANDPGLLRHAVAAGVRYIDTAAGYGDGETAVAGALHHVDGVRICTKIAATGTLDDIRRSIARLGRTPDTILVHSAGRAQIESAPAVAELHRAKAGGLTTRIGASTYGADDAAMALAQPWLDVVQVEYSILNQSVVAAVARTHPAQEVVVRSVLCKGLLTGRRHAAPHLAAQVQDAIDGIEACAREWGYGLETLAIRFALDTPDVDVVLVGVSTREELDAAIAAAAAPPLTHDQFRQVAAFDRRDADAVHPERWG
jgi:aryl-alcohol dehydrogenase-like predicted oxidoreductase